MTWTVAQVMTRDVVTVAPDASFKTCAELMRTHSISALPVVTSGNRLAGLVSEADLMVLAADRRRVARPPEAADLMTRDVATIAAGASLAAAARTMFARNVKRLLVVDATQHLVGIVSRSDILKVFLRSDEAIRREVATGLLGELPLLGRGRVQVEVREGVVHLFGEVESGSLTALLIRLVTAVPGVVGVENHLRQAGGPPADEAPKAGIGSGRHA
jgi:CBS domain-containing protein